MFEYAEFMDSQKQRVLQGNWDHIEAITGARRSGKTTLALNKALWWDPDFDLDAQLAFTSGEYIRKGLELSPGKPLILDEPIAGLLTMDSNSGGNKSLYRALTVVGERNLMHLLLIPTLKRLTGPLREDYIEYNSHVFKRGHAKLRQLCDLQGERVYDPPRVLNADFTFPDIPARLRVEYEKRKTKFVQSHGNPDGWDAIDNLVMEMRPRIKRYLERRGLSP